MISSLTLCVVIAILLFAAFNDIKHRRIPNILSLLLVVLYCIYAISGYFMDSTHDVDILDGLMVGGLLLALGLILFAVGAVGGGDVKLLAAVSLFAGTPYIAPLLILTALSGGLVASVIWIVSKMHPKQNKVDGANRHSVPYGVAITVSGIWLCIQLIKVGGFA